MSVASAWQVLGRSLPGTPCMCEGLCARQHTGPCPNRLGQLAAGSRYPVRLKLVNGRTLCVGCCEPYSSRASAPVFLHSATGRAEMRAHGHTNTRDGSSNRHTDSRPLRARVHPSRIGTADCTGLRPARGASQGALRGSDRFRAQTEGLRSLPEHTGSRPDQSGAAARRALGCFLSQSSNSYTRSERNLSALRFGQYSLAPLFGGARIMKDEKLYQRLRAYSLEDETGCWIWKKYVNPSGYGVIRVGPRAIVAHRAMWIALHGQPAPRMFVCHSCDVRACCNPGHLWLGTSADNNRDRDRKGRNGFASKTHCKRGHEFSPENTIRTRGGRECRLCSLIHHARYRAAKLPPSGKRRAPLLDDERRAQVLELRAQGLRFPRYLGEGNPVRPDAR